MEEDVLGLLETGQDIYPAVYEESFKNAVYGPKHFV